MQKDIHPEYAALEATCSCGNVIKTKSTRPGTMYLDVCSACHPFYTGKQKVVDTGGRIDRFKQRVGGRGQLLDRRDVLLHKLQHIFHELRHVLEPNFLRPAMAAR